MHFGHLIMRINLPIASHNLRLQCVQRISVTLIILQILHHQYRIRLPVQVAAFWCRPILLRGVVGVTALTTSPSLHRLFSISNAAFNHGLAHASTSHCYVCHTDVRRLPSDYACPHVIKHHLTNRGTAFEQQNTAALGFSLKRATALVSSDFGHCDLLRVYKRFKYVWNVH